MDTLAKRISSDSGSQHAVPVSHTDPWMAPVDAASSGTEELSDRQHSRFQRLDVLLEVRPESWLLNLFRPPVFQSAELRDISVSGASFQSTKPVRARRMSLRFRFDDGTEFLLAARLLKRHKQNLHRVQFLGRNQAFVDHLIKSSLNLRFHDSD
jgi:hypothetical protein